MPGRGFRRLLEATRIVDANTLYFSFTSEWNAKREKLTIVLEDLPHLVVAHEARRRDPYALNPSIELYDPRPTLRLANACESAMNCAYSMAEIAANFANRLSDGKLPSRFNVLRKRCEKDPALKVAGALGDLQWYRKVRELRTEWAHFSSIFIGTDKNGKTLLLVRAYRRNSDKGEFGSDFSCSVNDLIEWATGAIATLDAFAGYLLEEYVIPSLRPKLDQTMRVPLYDENGFPIIRNNLFANEMITVRECLKRYRIEVDE